MDTSADEKTPSRPIVVMNVWMFGESLNGTGSVKVNWPTAFNAKITGEMYSYQEQDQRMKSMANAHNVSDKSQRCIIERELFSENPEIIKCGTRINEIV
ncbi:hypothetical protein O9G_002975 [Rozella allomycis CSF55]|uniref:Uncharacterized protein n=1 Tax=Rozella allomycis (strain CSF55) TaxID=988480 RepID=A0A075AWP2_ROZAC|nr:hypothetical protein O9G_002975 [Rozella allomycis CSF55]|eukprot:EPZ34657.1 hypothetical protein O9G_002975 [Rozella allomycis CSF55]